MSTHAEPPLLWTTTTPTKPGHYWIRGWEGHPFNPDEDCALVVYVGHSPYEGRPGLRVTWHGRDDADDEEAVGHYAGAEWYGPIEMPEGHP